ncbi:MAG: YndJ family transporter, partial [Chloroflexota bacterium]
TALAAAAPLPAACSLVPGPMAGALAIPWLALSVVAGFAAGADALARLKQGGRLRAVPELGVDAALGFWTVGAAAMAAERLGLPAPFPPVIVLLTATHFHLAGAGLVAIAALLAMTRPVVAAAVIGLVAGIPVTALGFVLPSAAVGALGAALVGSSGIGVALALLTAGGPSVARLARRAAGTALLVGMPLGIGWSVAGLLGVGFLDIDTMVRTHGVLNAFAVVTVATWTRDRPPPGGQWRKIRIIQTAASPAEHVGPHAPADSASTGPSGRGLCGIGAPE